MEMGKIGIEITSFSISNFSYPEEVQQMITKAASQSMLGDVDKYQKISMVDAMASGKMNNNGSSMAADMMSMQMGMMMGQQMMNSMQQNQQQMPGTMQQNQQQVQNAQPQGGNNGAVPKFCPECGTKTNGAKFCSECGTKLV